MKRLLGRLGSWLGLLLPWVAAAQSPVGPGHALQLSGAAGAWVDCGPSDRGVTTELTVELWLRTTAPGPCVLIEKGEDALLQPGGFRLVLLDGRAELRSLEDVRGDFVGSGPSAVVLNDGRWHHLAGVRAGNSWRVYVDGLLVSQASFPPPGLPTASRQPLRLGGSLNPRWPAFAGELDEVRYWRVARTEREMRASMCHTFRAAPPELAGYYRFDETQGTTAADAGRAPTPGTLRGFGPAPWRPSGAALGDTSTQAYVVGGLPGALLGLVTATGDSAEAGPLQTPPLSLGGAYGLHLYAVGAAPQPPLAGALGSYVGVFVADNGMLSRGYALRLRPAAGPDCQHLWQRPDASGGFRGASRTVAGGWLLAAPAATRGEYALASGPTGQLPQVELGPDTVLCAGQALTLRAPAGAGYTYQWSDGSAGPTLTVREAGRYGLRVRTACGDEATGYRSISTRPCLTVPNILTPNGDGRNDQLVIPGLVGADWQLRVFNRWGREVYRSSSYQNDWTPPPGAATYHLRLEQAATGYRYRGWLQVRP